MLWLHFALIATALVKYKIRPTSLTIPFVFQDDIRINKTIDHKLICLFGSSQKVLQLFDFFKLSHSYNSHSYLVLDIFLPSCDDLI